MLAAICVVDSLSGSIFRPARLALKWATELGSTPTNRPLAISVTVSCPDSVTTLGCGGIQLAGAEVPRMSEPGMLS